MVTLSPSSQKFILHWGKMGDAWGINRSVAQIHALLFLSEKPLSAEEISETLSMARSNVSTSLRELLSWGLIRTVSDLGDRREQYESLTDVWEMFRKVLDERRKREFEPTIRAVRESLEDAERDKEPPEVRKRLAELLEFFETCDSAFSSVRRLSTPSFMRLFKFGTTIRKALGLTE